MAIDRTAIALAAGDARIEVAPQAGGSLASFSFRGANVLRPTSGEARMRGDVRAHACYPLVPYSNRIAHARLATAHGEHRLARNFGDSPHAIHGVGWQRGWSLVGHDASTALLALEHQPRDDDAHAWPFAFHASQRFALAETATGATLTATLTIASADARAFPFGLGWHPFFPRPPGATLAFEAAGIWENDATQIPLRLVAPGDSRAFSRARLLDEVALDNVFTQWPGSAALELPPPVGLRIVVEADTACSHLVVYVPPGRDFLAVEPVTHMTDAFNRARAGESGTGSRILEPGSAFSCTMRVTVAPRA